MGQKKALLGSIRKWQGIAFRDGEDHGRRNCPLCIAYSVNCCSGCIIAEHTGISACRNTPHERWRQLGREWMKSHPDLSKAIGIRARTPEMVQAAIDILGFLETIYAIYFDNPKVQVKTADNDCNKGEIK